MFDARRPARARFALVVSFCIALVAACGSSSDPGAGDGTEADGGPATVIPEGGTPIGSEGGVVAPSDSGTTTATKDASTTTQPHSGCGLTLKGPSWNISCQQWMNNNCCSEQLACAADTGCKALVDCIGACKGQNTSGCVNTCEQNATGGQSLLSAMGACSKSAPSDGGAAIPSKCSWP